MIGGGYGIGAQRGADRQIANTPWAGVLVVVLAAIAASAAGLDNGFAFDDAVVIADNARVHDLRWPWEYLAESYWGPARGNDLYRPLTILGFALQWAVGDGSPLPFHLANVALYAACSVAVLALARQLMAPAAAVLAALVFAVHPVHVEAVGNVVGQAELLVALAVISAVNLYVRDRRAGTLRGVTTVWIVLLYLAALLIKEHAIVMPLLLLAAEFALAPRAATPTADARPAPPTLRPRTGQDIAALRLLLLLCALVVVAYLTLRMSVIGRLAGDVPHPGIDNLSVAGRAWVMLGLLPDLARVLLWPVRLSADYSPQLVTLHPVPGVAHLPGLLLLAALGVVTFAWARRSRAATFGALWLLVGMALPSNLAVPTGVLMAERTMLLPSVGLAMLLGLLFAIAWRRDGRWTPVGRAAVCALLALAALRSSARQSAWEDNAAVISTMIAENPLLFRGHLMLGETFAVHGEFARAEPALRRAVELYPEFATSQLDYARVLQLGGRCAEAMPHFDAALARDPGSQVGQLNRAICLLKTGRLHDGRLRALQGLASGSSPSAFRAIRWTADSMLVAADSADTRNLFARTGREFDRLGGELDLRIRYTPPSEPVSTGKLQ